MTSRVVYDFMLILRRQFTSFSLPKYINQNYIHLCSALAGIAWSMLDANHMHYYGSNEFIHALQFAL